ncbi:uncharacterized protein ASPGLDRAFT_31158 [Aspergillus glaucus CBS 516.65]|uniref:SWIM-type domain-containing protein n=1 Tax=Aspergillus glaucus CBS 516.65 TaxID=1160497 RepID=A0A1L9VZV8_ASPGL|nr:hypothetical protein ASPGLDRAFT_31158 [Aspergillus glaucus CBS 516.65]OJJ89460.1 hypothetical protein ASPGLDRAFT_31158 [Aspergillus glaucus CBS 516.65]
MEIPDSDDEEEELLPDTIQNEYPKLQNKPISSPVQFVERILFQLNNISSTPQQHHNQQQQHEQQQNPFSTLSKPQASQVKPLMLTLHCLFPNELLLALDILDRGLVRRLVRGNQEEVCDLEIDTPSPSSFPHGLFSSQVPLVENSGREPVEDVFLVISAASSASIFTSTTTRQEGVKGYEVRLSAWNCTCPTFIFSAFRGETDSGESHHHDQSDDDYIYGNSASVAEQGCARTYHFGGTLTRGPTRLSPPSCKHLLACFLFVRCPRFFGTGEGAEPYRVSAKELAGWCAGWGG